MASKSDDFLERDGNNVFCTVHLRADELESGVRIRVKTRSGDKAEFDVPAGTPIGYMFRLQGLGYGAGSSRGDQFVRIDEFVLESESMAVASREEVTVERYRKSEPRRQAPRYGFRIFIACGLAAVCVWLVFNMVRKLFFPPGTQAESSFVEIKSPFIQKQKGNSFVCAESTVVIVNNRNRGNLKFQYRVPGRLSYPLPSPYEGWSQPYEDGWMDCVTKGEEYFAFLFREPGEIKFSRWTKVAVESQLATDRVRIVSLKHNPGVPGWNFAPVVSVYVNGLTADQVGDRHSAVLHSHGELINVDFLEKDDFYFFTVFGESIYAWPHGIDIAPIEITWCQVMNSNLTKIHNPGQWLPVPYEDVNRYVARRLERVNVTEGWSQHAVIQVGYGIPVTGRMQAKALAYKAGIGGLLKVYRLRARKVTISKTEVTKFFQERYGRDTNEVLFQKLVIYLLTLSVGERRELIRSWETSGNFPDSGEINSLFHDAMTNRFGIVVEYFHKSSNTGGVAALNDLFNQAMMSFLNFCPELHPGKRR